MQKEQKNNSEHKLQCDAATVPYWASWTNPWMEENKKKKQYNTPFSYKFELVGARYSVCVCVCVCAWTRRLKRSITTFLNTPVDYVENVVVVVFFSFLDSISRFVAAMLNTTVLSLIFTLTTEILVLFLFVISLRCHKTFSGHFPHRFCLVLLLVNVST